MRIWRRRGDEAAFCFARGRRSGVAYEMPYLSISIISWILKTCLGIGKELLGPADVALLPRPLSICTLAHMNRILFKAADSICQPGSENSTVYAIPK